TSRLATSSAPAGCPRPTARAARATLPVRARRATRLPTSASPSRSASDQSSLWLRCAGLPPRAISESFRELRSSGIVARVRGLLGGELGDPHAHGLQLQARDLLIELARQLVDFLVERLAFLGEPAQREVLVRERHVHDLARVALGRGEVDEAALG